METQTDNSYFRDKVELRKNHLPSQPIIRVLDCYCGTGRIWNAIKSEIPDRKFVMTSIDIKPKKPLCLIGDNLKYLKSLNLNKYDIIDLDSYGIPFEQLQIIFDRKRILDHAVKVFVTIVQSQYGCINKRLLEEIGYSARMTEKIPTLFYKNGFGKIKQYLAQNGVKEIYYRESNNKHYLYFEI
jgi:hypothetical protein